MKYNELPEWAQKQVKQWVKDQFLQHDEEARKSGEDVPYYTEWGWHQTKDDEKRCFANYTQYPNKAEVYSLQDWLDSGYGSIIKMDEPVHMTIDLCKKYKNYDTVLIDKEEYIGYCKMACLPLDHPTAKGGVE